jgi:hypothetical protein
MATTIIQKGQIRRRTKLMPLRRAQSFAKALDAKGNSALEIEVVPNGNGRARVQFTPSKAKTVARHFNVKQGERAGRAVDVRAYMWRRIGRRQWRCWDADRISYCIYLDKPLCTCPDWEHVHSAGLFCKHYLCAEECERRWERDRGKAGV